MTDKKERREVVRLESDEDKTNLYNWVRAQIKSHCRRDQEGVESRMLRRILWERAKGELISMTYTYREESDNRTRMLTAVNDFLTVVENYLGQEDEGGIFHE